MLASQKWELKKVELRAAIDAFPDDGNADDLLKLTAEYRKADAEYAKAIILEAADADAARAAGDLDAGQRELDGIGGNLQFRRYVAAAVEMRAADGAEGEYNAGHGLSGRQFPLAMLAPTQMRTTTSANGQQTQQTWLDRLFAESTAMYLGLNMESVPAGTAAYPVTTAGAGPTQRDKEEAATASAWTVGVDVMTPKRMAALVQYTIEDSARLPGLADALRRDLGMALTEKMDAAMQVGDTGATTAANDIAGLTTAANVTEVEVKQADVAKPSEYVGYFAGLVDGIHAGEYEQLRTVISPAVFKLLNETPYNADAENQSVFEYLAAQGIMMRVRDGIGADTAANAFGALTSRQRGIDGAGVAAVWDAGQLIVDEITGADSGEVKLTLNALWDFALPRPSNFARLKYVA